MFNKEMYQKNVEKILKTKKNYRLYFEYFYYYRNSGFSCQEINKTLKLNWRTIIKMEKSYNLLEKIHQVTPERAIKEFVFSTLNELKLFEFLISGNNFFLKYNEINEIYPISRYFYNRVKQYIIDELQ